MSDKPENTKENTKRALPKAAEPYKWKPGQTGNAGGRPKKKPITELYAEILDDPEALDDLRKLVRRLFLKGNMAAVLQLKEMTDRVEGKVTQTIDADLKISSLSERMAKARERLNSEGSE